MESLPWSETVILADAAFLDRMAFELTVYFERLLGRRIPKADLAKWADCAALDGGLLPGDNQVQVVLLHPADKAVLENFLPTSLNEELDGKAFKDALGEFTFHAASPEQFASLSDFFAQSLELILSAKSVTRIIIAADLQAYGSHLKELLASATEKDITLLVLQPFTGRGFQQEKLAYSLMTALGISGDELE